MWSYVILNIDDQEENLPLSDGNIIRLLGDSPKHWCIDKKKRAKFEVLQPFEEPLPVHMVHGKLHSGASIQKCCPWNSALTIIIKTALVVCDVRVLTYVN
ncbi:unnamed protein product [Caenorhabditis angaria]|uniref:Uncharacterized protein n=1 Tax=Caenorhabditis angaria TaxID=860376 RepID=A0A9P1IX39_9PELO|nr:unnamed protein product [Caenorhabditis angaria]